MLACLSAERFVMSDAQKVVFAFWLMVALLAFAAFSGALP
jgi:hypothetical protein